MNTTARSESFHAVGEQAAVTLREAQLVLERFAEGEATARELKKCAELMHSVRGALNIASVYGAGLLAEEMEATCEYMFASDSERARTEGIEALSRAMVQLPAYIERVMDGGRDIPLAVLPLLNDLRAARGKPLLSESTLLLLNGELPADNAQLTRPEPSGEDIAALLPQLRPQYQLGLLGWIKGSDSEQNLQRMIAAVNRLQLAAVADEAYRLWWVVGGVLEALAEQGLESSIALKRLLGQVDREIKRLQLSGEVDFVNQPPSELINNLLYYVARSTHGGAQCTVLQSAFNLAGVGDGDDQVEALRESLSAPSPRLMKTVANAISEDLSRVKDVLDIYVRTGMEDAAELSEQVELLRKIGDTLGVLGLGKLRETVLQHSVELRALVDAEEIEERRLVDMAAALLAVEGALEGELVSLVRPAQDDVDEPPDIDFQAVTEAVLRECMINFAHIKEAITEVLAKSDDQRGLDRLPEQLRGVSAGLMMLGFVRAVEVLRRIGEAIQVHLLGDSVRREPGSLNRLADAIVSLEYYMKTLQAGRKEPVYMLENSERSLAALEAIVPEHAPDDSTAHVGTMPSPHEDLPDSIATPASHEKTLIIEAPVMETGGEPVDIELLEIFIEEAREEIGVINRRFLGWLNNQADEEALIAVRRSYHTLKGSGRMVGARLFGEYAWSVENLLNRVISQTISTGPELQAFLSVAIAVTPQLLEQLEVGTDPEADIAALVAIAERFANGEIPDEYLQSADMTEDQADIQSVVEEIDEPAGIDPVLLDILVRETENHLATIRGFIEQSAAEGIAVDTAMHHACHTLHGSTTMANVTEIAGLTDALDQFIEAVFRREEGLDGVQRELCLGVADAVEALISHLQDEDLALPETTGLEARLQEMTIAIVAQALGEEQQSQTITPDTLMDLDLIGSDEVAAEISGLDLDLSESLSQDDAPDTSAASGIEFDVEIAAIFTDEATEILAAVDGAIRVLSDDGGSDAALEDLQRHLHTLKGGARMAGISSMGDFSHELESLLIHIARGGAGVDGDVLLLLQQCVDELHRMREQVESGVLSPPDTELRGRLAIASDATMIAPPPVEEAHTADAGIREDEAAGETEALGRDSVVDSGREEPVAESEPPLHIPEPESLGELARDLISGTAPEQPESLPELFAPPQQAETGQRRETARVDSAMLEDLLNNAGEISISHSRLKQQVSSIHFNLEELGQTVQRLQQQLRLLEMETEAQILFKHQDDASSSDEEFDPLELDRYSTIQQLARGLGETANDVSSLKDLLQNVVSDTETILSQQQRLTSELQDNLMRTRMVPFEQHVPRLQRLIRQQAQESGKRVELTVRGSSGELDRQVMERMLAPFEHMLRNAVIHGIEPAADREAAGKNDPAMIVITFRREGSHVLIDIADDGAGIDLEHVKTKAIEQGVIQADQSLSDEELAQLILRSGLSTADKLTQSAGRGIGMDVVVNEISKLGGTLAITTEPEKGCTFTVRLPYTLAITQAFIVQVGPESFALPLASVDGVVRISRAEFDERMGQKEPVVEYGGRRYRLQYLGMYLGLGPARLSADQGRISIVLVAAGENSTALITDDTADLREIVIKPIGSQLVGLPGIAGATILGDGRIVVILDAGSLVRMPVPEFDPEELVKDEEENLPPLALVVDDSITMRRVTQRLLERNGMRVITAKDGFEALEVLQDRRPKIILLDVEMPRMDGYEFASRVRNNPETASMPIVMVTSRSGEKHRARAIEIGVDDYLGKPYQEHEMLDAIRNLLGEDFNAAGMNEKLK